MSGAKQTTNLPNHSRNFIAGAKWVLDRLYAGESLKDLEHLVDAQARKNHKQQLSDERFPTIMAGYRVPLHRRD